jgi:hypothetical protein
MPELDRDTGRLLVRIAFDGPPLAGKTAIGVLAIPVVAILIILAVT